MKVTVSRTKLASAIGKIQAIISSKPTLPILANILIEAHSNGLTLYTTDLTISMRAFLEAKVEEEGAITLPARRFFQLIRELIVDQVNIQTTAGEIAHMQAGSSHFRLNGLHKSEYPTLPDLTNALNFSITPTTLQEMLTKTSFAAALDDSRQALNGISLQIQNNQATFIGTDGKRLAKVLTEIDLETAPAEEYLIPLKAVEEINKMLEGEESCKVSLLSDKIAIETDSLILITKLLSGQFPDVNRVIPEKIEHKIVLHREELITLLKQISLFTTDRSHAVHFIFSPGELQLIGSSTEIGEGKVSMPIDYSGEKFEAAFNPYFFLDVIRHCRDETVNFGISDPYTPGMITDSTSAIFVIMPMRLNPSE